MAACGQERSIDIKPTKQAALRQDKPISGQADTALKMTRLLAHNQFT